LNALGEVLCQCGEPDSAEPFLREALAKCRKYLGDEDPYTATTFLSLASMLRSTGEYSAAESLAVEAMAIQRQSQGCVDLYVAECLSHMADTYVAQRKSGQAASCLREALQSYTRVLGEDHPSVVAAKHELGRCILAQDKPSDAESLLQNAAAAFETARLRVGSGYSRAAFQDSPYATLAAARLLLGKEFEAWPAAERALGRALADLIIAAERRSLSPMECARQDSLQQVLGRLEDKLTALQETALKDTTIAVSEEIDDVRIRLAAANAAWTAFQREIAHRYPVTEGRAFDVRRVQRTLSDRTALIGWLHLEASRGDFAAWGYVIRNEGPVRWVRLDTSIGEDEVQSPLEKACDFREALVIAASWTVRPTDVSRLIGEAAGLCERWVTPLESHLEGVEHLVVIPSGPMLGVPVEALVDSDDVFLTDRYTISYAPSATLHTWLWEQGVDKGTPLTRKALLVGDPPFTSDQLTAMVQERDQSRRDEDSRFSTLELATQRSVLRSALAGNQEALAALPRLPWTRKEVERVAAVIPNAAILVGSEASEQQLVALAESGDLRDFDTIHLATHALVDDERPERSALVLSRASLPDPYEAIVAGERIHDGLLTAKEIVREWDLEADLVTLSGCQTGLGKETTGEGYIGLAHAFLQAGARSLLVSLWKVEEEATALLMTRFYENLTGTYVDERDGRYGEPMPKAGALREAKRWLRTYSEPSDSGEGYWQPFRHPSYWSGFILIGEP
jgi:CHAT domain-containing protein/tetratricopeptide (TPR) repeat protein